MLQYKHDYRLVDKALSSILLARRMVASGLALSARKCLDDARRALLGYVYKENVVPVVEGENGWVKMDDALQLTFTREQLDCIRWYIGERLKEYPENELASVQLAVINRCQELLNCPCFNSVRDFVTYDLGNWGKIKLPL